MVLVMQTGCSEPLDTITGLAASEEASRAGEARGRKTKIYTAGKSDRALPAFAEPAAKQAGDERHEANCKEVHDREGARDQERDQHGDGGRDARLENRPSRRLKSNDEAADGEARKLSTAASTICPPRSSTSLGLATPSNCGARKSPRIRPAIKLSTTITTTPMPIHFQSKVPVISSSFG